MRAAYDTVAFTEKDLFSDCSESDSGPGTGSCFDPELGSDPDIEPGTGVGSDPDIEPGTGVGSDPDPGVESDSNLDVNDDDDAGSSGKV